MMVLRFVRERRKWCLPCGGHFHERRGSFVFVTGNETSTVVVTSIVEVEVAVIVVVFTAYEIGNE